MIQLKRILVPSDFSDYSKHALRYGCAFAVEFGADLYLLHVMQDIVGLVPEDGIAFPPTGDYWRELRESAEKALEQLPGSLWSGGESVVRTTREGAPFLEIVRYAKEHEIDLIVMGTHGRTGLSHILVGSVAERVVRKAPCPVLTVRHPEHEFVMP